VGENRLNSHSFERWHVSENSKRVSGISEVTGTSQKFNLVAWNQLLDRGIFRQAMGDGCNRIISPKN
jgi:hypothetical protein